jgi:hypothetical protein
MTELSLELPLDSSGSHRLTARNLLTAGNKIPKTSAFLSISGIYGSANSQNLIVPHHFTEPGNVKSLKPQDSSGSHSLMEANLFLAARTNFENLSIPQHFWCLRLSKL